MTIQKMLDKRKEHNGVQVPVDIRLEYLGVNDNGEYRVRATPMDGSLDTEIFYVQGNTFWTTPEDRK